MASGYRTPIVIAAVLVTAAGLSGHGYNSQLWHAGELSASGPHSHGKIVRMGRHMAAQYGWTAGNGQFACLNELWTRESGWDPYNTYPSHDTSPSTPSSAITTAYGIPQALPAQKMATAGPDWQANPRTQIKWGLGYIKGRYGSPCAAWNFELANNGY